jgi:SIR2-like domain
MVLDNRARKGGPIPLTSKDIVGAPSILFLGAGSSRPFGKMLMGEFVDWFRRKREAALGRAMLSATRSDLLDALCAEREDLEFLIEELHSLSSKDYLANRTRTTYPGADSLGPGLSSEEQLWPEFSKLAAEAKLLLADLKKEVYLHYREFDESGDMSALADLLQLISPQYNPTVVFTTNYDPGVETVCARLGWAITDGFVHLDRAYVWNRSAFDEIETQSERSLVLFKLHGSANWARDGGRIVQSLPVYDGSDPDYRNVMIYPATRKIAIEEPFFTAYDYLEKCLNTSRVCLVVGYSFRDYDTLMRFKSASLSNPNLLVAVLDPDAEAICVNLKKNGIRATPVCYAVGDLKFKEEYLRKIITTLSAGLKPAKACPRTQG